MRALPAAATATVSALPLTDRRSSATRPSISSRCCAHHVLASERLQARASRQASNASRNCIASALSSFRAHAFESRVANLIAKPFQIGFVEPFATQQRTEPFFAHRRRRFDDSELLFRCPPLAATGLSVAHSTQPGFRKPPRQRGL